MINAKAINTNNDPNIFNTSWTLCVPLSFGVLLFWLSFVPDTNDSLLSSCVFLLSSSNFVSSLAFSGSVDSSTFVIILGTLGVVFEVLLFLSDVLGLLSSGVFGSSGFVAGTSSFTNILNCVVNPSYVTFITCIPALFLSYPDTISAVILITCVPLSFTTFNVAPVKSKFSPFLYSSLLGNVLIDIPNVLSFTVTLYWYVLLLNVTVICFVPGIVLSNPLIILFVKSYLFPSFSLAYTSVIDPPVKSIVSPILYSFFVGATNFVSFM